MQGFIDSVPLTVAVAWLKNSAGAYVETQLLSGQSFPEGLLAYTDDGTGTITRWFVPWTSVVYIKQTQPTLASGPAPVVPAVTTTGPPGDPRNGH